MHREKIRSISVCSTILFAGMVLFESEADLTQAFKDETDAKIEQLRKTDYVIEVQDQNGLPLGNASLDIEMIKHHFGFGASIGFKFMYPDTADSNAPDVDGEAYRAAFKEYFEWATPENVMKWYATDTTNNQDTIHGCEPGDYTKGDSLVKWCRENGISVRGHNLFWNERVEFQAYCARPYGPYNPTDSSRTIKTVSDTARDLFVDAVGLRLTEMVQRYKDKVKHWDVVNEVVHFTTDDNGDRRVEVPGLFATWAKKTGNGGAEVFNWILDSSRALDPDVKLCVNEYNVIEKSHDEDAYISMINKINGGARENAKIDIVGLEGHFGDLLSRTQTGSYPGYESLIDKIAEGIHLQDSDMKFWFTEVDWNSEAGGNAADKLEELMRFAYSREDFGGVVIWVWWQGNRWRDNLVSFVANDDFSPSEAGSRWNSLRKEKWWTGPINDAMTDNSGKFTWRGFQGEYKVSVTYQTLKIDTSFMLEPGETTFKLAIPVTTIRSRVHHFGNGSMALRLNGGKPVIINPKHETGEPLYLSVYSLSGKLLHRKQIETNAGTDISAALPRGCHLFTIGSGTRTYYRSLGLETR